MTGDKINKIRTVRYQEECQTNSQGNRQKVNGPAMPGSEVPVPTVHAAISPVHHVMDGKSCSNFVTSFLAHIQPTRRFSSVSHQQGKALKAQVQGEKNLMSSGRSNKFSFKYVNDYTYCSHPRTPLMSTIYALVDIFHVHV